MNPETKEKLLQACVNEIRNEYILFNTRENTQQQKEETIREILRKLIDSVVAEMKAIPQTEYPHLSGVLTHINNGETPPTQPIFGPGEEDDET